MSHESYAYNALMVSHAGEIGIKSKTTRRFMIKRLYKNIVTKFPDYSLDFKNIANRTIIFTDQPAILSKAIANIIFGVSHTAPVYFFNWSSYDSLQDTFIGYARQFMKPTMSFGFASRTSGKNRPSSQSLKVELGSKLYEAFDGSIRVDLTHPDFLFTVEVRDEFAWIYHERFQGLDGFPPGAQKGVMFSNLRNWVPDYVAMFLTMKRGVNVRPVHFLTNPDDDSSQQAAHDQFIKDFVFLKPITIPLYEVLQSWQETFGDNLCSACMFFSERLLAKAVKLREAAGFISGVRISSLDGDISNDCLRWFESQNSILKIRPNLLSKLEFLEQSKYFNSFPKAEACCPFQNKRFISSMLDPEEITLIDEQADLFATQYFSPSPIKNEDFDENFS